MRTGRLLGILLLVGTVWLGSCIDDENSGSERKITGYEEYTLTVASAKLKGIVYGCSDYLSDVYAVKREDAGEWKPFASYINGFDYENGYEYRIRISETDYLDYRMGEPAWSEYKLLEVLSKEKKESERLPADFVPAWWKGETP